ncbi:NAD(+) synthase [candidate division WOR-3 bacterium RBG_13_43_14]|uniref:NH(3)-dependent NAD(+) synthetase n=1 Tax=candidate division WOR-3 bacterium RBG_13_43_14 TaxID=1802590 RepID=A0A1F4UEL3_UNCW3|nr:MAG: NAD(+) synthase [candidate division WOR-3 bacterium RBG_13_43_14]
MSESKIELIVKWLKEQISTSGTAGYVLGLSGGVDSAVCAGLIRKATSNALALILPIESDPADITDAQSVASVFNLKYEYIDLTQIYDNLIKILPDSNRVVQGNLKARLRMILLYYYANINNLLVCGTGNKTELLLGYFTKYGDGASDVLPLGDLYKYQVREIAGEMGIPERIIKKIPSAGLWLGQTDEAEIGYNYAEIDKTLDQIAQGKIEGDCAKKLKQMIDRNEHKRKPTKIFSVNKS